ncbi:MAG TPA: cobalamin-dependent protein, partial [Methanospirillum sp.]|uniref:cobalamin B12-binding domain-containing protein n=1 Tax=Methanospirillum sp. TaxID=45200 RepID=UPI002BAD73B2
NGERTDFSYLIDFLLDGNVSKSQAYSRMLMANGFSGEEIVKEGIQVAMDRLDHKCTLEEFNLLEIMLAGRAVMGVVREIYPDETPPSNHRGTIVIASLEGDIHDLGKHIVKMALIGNRYRVVDCGKDVPMQMLIQTIIQEQAVAVCISGLITSIIPQVQQIRGMLSDMGMHHVLIIAGGAALKQTDSEYLNVDYVCQTAFDAINYLNKHQEGG